MFEKCIYYHIGDDTNKIKHFLKLLVPLALPYFIIYVLNKLVHFQETQQVNIVFSCACCVASIWFICGPHLLFNYIKYFIDLRVNANLCSEVKKYFIEKEREHFVFYKKCLLLCDCLIIIVSVLPIIISPEILSYNVTSGVRDPFFWLVLVFLVWFLCYCANSPAFILLLSLKIIKDIVNNKVLNYDPLNIEHHKSIEHILKLCNKAVYYTCSALLFMPLAVYYILKQPKWCFDFHSHTFSALEFYNTDGFNINLLWVSCILIVFSMFLFAFVFYPTYAIKKYIKNKSNEKILLEEIKYIDSTSTFVLPNVNILFIELYKYNTYLRLQEIKIICKSSVKNIDKFDKNIAITYISIVITLICSIPGFSNLF